MVLRLLFLVILLLRLDAKDLVIVDDSKDSLNPEVTSEIGLDNSKLSSKLMSSRISAGYKSLAYKDTSSKQLYSIDKNQEGFYLDGKLNLNHTPIDNIALEVNYLSDSSTIDIANIGLIYDYAMSNSIFLKLGFIYKYTSYVGIPRAESGYPNIDTKGFKDNCFGFLGGLGAFLYKDKLYAEASYSKLNNGCGEGESFNISNDSRGNPFEAVDFKLRYLVYKGLFLDLGYTLNLGSGYEYVYEKRDSTVSDKSESSYLTLEDNLYFGVGWSF